MGKEKIRQSGMSRDSGRPWPRERFMRMSGGHSKVSSILRASRDILSVAITAFIFIGVILRIIVILFLNVYKRLCLFPDLQKQVFQ